MKKVLFFVPNMSADNSAVLETQVFKQMRSLQAAGVDTLFLGIAGNGPVASKKIAAYGLRGDIREYADAGRYERFWMGIYSSLKIARATPRIEDLSHIYIRNVGALPGALLIKYRHGARLVVDFRGLVSEELEESGSKVSLALKKTILKLFEKLTLATADNVFCVSHPLKDYLKARTSKEIHVVPSCVDENEALAAIRTRNDIRKSLGFNPEDQVLVYCGGISHWQRIDEILAIMKHCVERTPGVRCMILTTQPAPFKEFFARANILERVVIRSVPPDDVLNYVAAGDVGIILRDPTLMNLVASPIKIAEYLSVGLPVVCNNGVGDAAKRIAEEKAGVVAKDDMASMANALETVLDQLPEMRENALRLGQAYYTWQANQSIYSRAYLR